MPIVRRADPSEPLSQGDILQRVTIFVASVDDKPAAYQNAKYALVVSRPCKALRDEHVVVAPVQPYPLELGALFKKDKDPAENAVGKFDKMRRLMSSQRDGISGTSFSDTLYLGTLEDGSPSRFGARLSLLGSVIVPSDDEHRSRWVADRRVARLELDFVRDLHVRFALTFQKLGFEDESWFCDEDLEIIVSAGESELNQLERVVIDKRLEIQHAGAANLALAAKHQKSLEQALEKATKDVADMQAQLAPYQRERAKRSRL